MKKDYKISIIIPAFNEEKNLEFLSKKSFQQ